MSAMTTLITRLRREEKYLVSSAKLLLSWEKKREGVEHVQYISSRHEVGMQSNDIDKVMNFRLDFQGKVAQFCGQNDQSLTISPKPPSSCGQNIKSGTSNLCRKVI